MADIAHLFHQEYMLADAWASGHKLSREHWLAGLHMRLMTKLLGLGWK